MNKLISYQSLLFFLSIILSVGLASHAMANTQKVTIVLDMQNKPMLPRRFRSTLNLPKDQNFNWQQLQEIKMAGSGQFSKLALDAVIKHMQTKQGAVIDLRQECHGFLDDNAVSWYSDQFATNAKISPAEIERIEDHLLEDLSKNKIVMVDKILEKDRGVILKSKPIEFMVRHVASEEEVVRAKHLQYLRLHVQNYWPPRDEEVDKLLTFLAHLPKTSWIYFHCRAGSGRTTTLMTMIDMLHHAKDASFEEILNRQKAWGGKDLLFIPEKTHYKYQPSVVRLVFLKRFYDYARRYGEKPSVSWKEYVKSDSR